MRHTHFAAILAAAAVVAGCGGGEGNGGSETLTVYVSLPLSGPAAADGRDAADGARLALAIGREVGGVEVRARFLDAGAPGRGWTPARSAANARAATRDSTAVAYVGDFQSGATRASLPITNQAFMLQVSPASGASDLVVEFPGSDDVSDLQTTGERTFGRVIPSDERQAAAAAAWARELGWPRVTVISDGSPYGRVLNDAFRQAANGTGLDPGPGARYAFIAGSDPALLRRAVDEDIPLGPARPSTRMATDAFLPPYGEADVLATSAAVDPTDLPPAGREFPERFTGEYGRRPGRYAAYGYEAMAVVLDSIDRADDPADRRSVVDAFFETTERDSVLGLYSVTEEGETTIDRMTGYEVRGGEPKPLTTLVVP